MAGKNEVTIDVVVREHGGKKVIKDVGDEAQKTGKKFEGTGKDAKKLGQEMYELEVRLKNAAKEFKRTGEMDLDLAKTLRRNQGQLRSLTKLRKEILGLAEPSGGGGGGGGGAGGKFGQELTESLRALKGPAIAGAVVIAAAMAPFLGAAVGAAILGGAGAGGIIGGIALAARDSRVQDEGAKLAAHLGEVFGRAGEPMVGPTVGALHVLSGVADDVSGDLKDAFATVAPVLVPLAQGIGGLVNQTMPGFTKAMEAAKPVLRVIADELPETGRALSQMFETIAQDPDGAIMAMKTLFQIIDGTVRVTGDLVHGLSEAFEWTQKAAANTSDWMTSVPGWVGAVLPQFGLLQQYSGKLNDDLHAQVGSITRAKDASKDYFGSLTGVGESAEKARQRIEGLNNTLDKFFDRTMNLRSANREYEAAVDNLTETIKENGKTLDERTEKGRANQQAIDDNVRAIKELRQANIDNGMSVADANTIYDQQLEQLRKTLIKLGLNKQMVNDTIDLIKQWPALAETEFRFPGLLAGLAQARELAALLGSGSAAARFRAGDTSGYGGGRASGGFMAPGMTYDVAESGTGVEKVKMLRGGGAVVANADQWSAAGGGGGGWTGGGGGAQVMHVVFEVRSSGGRWAEFLAAEIREQVAAIGGGDVQRTYGRRMN